MVKTYNQKRAARAAQALKKKNTNKMTKKQQRAADETQRIEERDKKIKAKRKARKK